MHEFELERGNEDNLEGKILIYSAQSVDNNPILYPILFADMDRTNFFEILTELALPAKISTLKAPYSTIVMTPSLDFVQDTCHHSDWIHVEQLPDDLHWTTKFGLLKDAYFEKHRKQRADIASLDLQFRLIEPREVTIGRERQATFRNHIGKNTLVDYIMNKYLNPMMIAANNREKEETEKLAKGLWIFSYGSKYFKEIVQLVDEIRKGSNADYRAMSQCLSRIGSIHEINDIRISCSAQHHQT